MKLGFVADVHIANHRKHGGHAHAGINRRARLVLDALDRACQRAVDEGCTALVVAGDLFDSARPEPQLLAAAASVLGARDEDLFVYVLAGNHDIVSGTPGDHALGPLHHIDNVAVVDAPRLLCLTGVEVIAVPYRAGVVGAWLPGVLAELTKGRPAVPRVLALHAGLRDATTAPWLLGAPDAIDADALLALMAAHGVEFAAAGNWHWHAWWSAGAGRPTAVQCGALAPSGFKDLGLVGYGSLVVYDTTARAWQRIEVPGPRFVKLTGAGADAALPAMAAGFEPGLLHVAWEVPPSLLGGASAALAAHELELGLGGASVVPDGGAVATARVAAASAASTVQTSLDDAVRAFVAAMPLDATVDRGAVLQRVQRALTRA